GGEGEARRQGAAWPVLHHDRLPDLRLEFGGQDAREDVRRTARSLGNDEPDQPVRIFGACRPPSERPCPTGKQQRRKRGNRARPQTVWAAAISGIRQVLLPQATLRAERYPTAALFCHSNFAGDENGRVASTTFGVEIEFQVPRIEALDGQI